MDYPTKQASRGALPDATVRGTSSTLGDMLTAPKRSLFIAFFDQATIVRSPFGMPCEVMEVMGVE